MHCYSDSILTPIVAGTLVSLRSTASQCYSVPDIGTRQSHFLVLVTTISVNDFDYS
jgi:hypothetical protein